MNAFEEALHGVSAEKLMEAASVSDSILDGVEALGEVADIPKVALMNSIATLAVRRIYNDHGFEAVEQMLFAVHSVAKKVDQEAQEKAKKTTTAIIRRIK